MAGKLKFFEGKYFRVKPPIWAKLVLILAAYESPFGKPKNILLGHILSALSGVFVFSTLGFSFLSVGLAVGLAIFLMMTTKTVHPPAGANPIIAVLGAKGVGFVLMPVAVGATFIVLFAIIYNKLLKRKYFTFKDWK